LRFPTRRALPQKFSRKATNCVWIRHSIVCGPGFETAGRTREVEVGETFEILMQRSALKFSASFFKAADLIKIL
jgi:hypothetical protein